MTDTPTPAAPSNDRSQYERLAQIERESQDHRDHRTRVQTLLGLASGASTYATITSLFASGGQYGTTADASGSVVVDNLTIRPVS